MNISVVGSGYVGTTIAACFTELGHNVIVIEIDEDIVTSINVGESPIHEPGIGPLLETNGGNGLRATTEYSAINETEATFLALPTPSNPDGSIDLSVVLSGAKSVGRTLSQVSITDITNPHLIVVKSTVVPGSTEGAITDAVIDGTDGGRNERVRLAVNPEFLREGSAVSDFLHPDKIVLGTESNDSWARRMLDAIYEPLVGTAETKPTIVHTGLREAEMIKYANNAFLAAKISLINELGNICKEYDIDAYEVANAIGLDHRIGDRFLDSGVGWGGSCFPKDINALIAVARAVEYEPKLLEAAVAVNELQPQRMVRLLERHIDPEGLRVAVLGLSFKPGTDDVRYSRAIPIIEGVRRLGAKVIAYDPVANENMADVFPDITYATSAKEALNEANAALVVTDWEEFGTLDTEFDTMSTPIVIDGRRIITRRDGITYEGLTW